MKYLILTMVVLVGLCPRNVLAGLYDDVDKKTEITSGDLNSQDYWWTKYDMMMLDLALKQHQPEGQIGLDLASTKNRIDSLLKEYPKHEEIKKWKEKVDDVLSKINPDAPRGGGFNPGCPWDESNFAQLWVNYHYAKAKLDANERDEAYGLYLNVEQNLDIMLKPDRMKDYPDDLRKWVQDAKPEVDKIVADLKEKMAH
jgi:hypothetical protein